MKRMLITKIYLFMICIMYFAQSFLLRNVIVNHLKKYRHVYITALNINSDDKNLEMGSNLSYKPAKKNVSDNRDFMPFIAYDIDQDNYEIGTFLLDSSTACGDILDLGSKGIFKVKKVIFLYKFDGRNYRVIKKKLEVISTTTHWKGSKEALGIITNSNLRDDGYLQ